MKHLETAIKVVKNDVTINSRNAKIIYKYAELLDLIENNTEPVEIIEMDADHVKFKPSSDNNNGYVTLDCLGKKIAVTNGTHAVVYEFTSRKVVDGLYVCKARRGRLPLDYTEDGFTDGRDSRNFLKLNTITESGAVENNMFREYTYNCLVYNKDAREKLAAAIADGTAYRLVVNHMNNDSRDASYANVELVTSKENNIHGSMVKLIANYTPQLIAGTYVVHGNINCTSSTVKYKLNFRLPAKIAVQAIESSLHVITDYVLASSNIDE